MEYLLKRLKRVYFLRGVYSAYHETPLSGVRVGRGSVVAVVTKSCPPYSVIEGVPTKLIKPRLTEEEIVMHETQLCSLQDHLIPNRILYVIDLISTAVLS